jgi:SAM-dependent methyltransferase
MNLWLGQQRIQARPREIEMTVQEKKPIGPAAGIDEAKLNAFVEKVLDDWGAISSAPLVLIGDKLGLYDALADAGPVTSEELAQRTGTDERYLREWLLNQAASGYLEYDPTTSRYTLPPEHAAALPSLFGGFQTYLAAAKAESRIAAAFRTGEGMPWGEHDPGVFKGVERVFRPGYEQFLVSSWIPALDGVASKLEQGATAADVGCGHGASTIILAQAYPRSRFVGFDNHPASIEAARQAAAEAGVADRASFEVISATHYPAPLAGYDLIAFFDCLHDLGDPVGAVQHAHATLASEGTVLIVEPMAGERVEDNLTPLGRALSGASTLLCTPHSRAADGPALGALASEARLREVVTAGGFSRFHRATETPFNRIFEARK